MSDRENWPQGPDAQSGSVIWVLASEIPEIGSRDISLIVEGGFGDKPRLPGSFCSAPQHVVPTKHDGRPVYLVMWRYD